ncbi:hypothetical protein ACFSL4_17580 [Streptomyces caeni]|uniref:Uncharacterized protein n=1 Tax=Streptomyces caeni TaxID=2307231 RepID=A0ABW4ISB1_9ACTN
MVFLEPTAEARSAAPGRQARSAVQGARIAVRQAEEDRQAEEEMSREHFARHDGGVVGPARSDAHERDLDLLGGRHQPAS